MPSEGKKACSAPNDLQINHDERFVFNNSDKRSIVHGTKPLTWLGAQPFCAVETLRLNLAETS